LDHFVADVFFLLELLLPIKDVGHE
jgi:hypothetical protein